MRALQRLSAWGKQHPRALGSLSGAGLGGLGDLASQRIEKAERVDLWRSSLVSLWYSGAGWFFWTPFLAWQTRAFGAHGLTSVVGKVATFNAAVSSIDITGFHLVAIAPRVGLDEALRTLREGYSETVFMGLALWTPGMAECFKGLNVSRGLRSDAEGHSVLFLRGALSVRSRLHCSRRTHATGCVEATNRQARMAFAGAGFWALRHGSDIPGGAAAPAVAHGVSSRPHLHFKTPKQPPIHTYSQPPFIAPIHTLFTPYSHPVLHLRYTLDVVWACVLSYLSNARRAAS